MYHKIEDFDRGQTIEKNIKNVHQRLFFLLCCSCARKGQKKGDAVAGRARSDAALRITLTPRDQWVSRYFW